MSQPAAVPIRLRDKVFGRPRNLVVLKFSALLWLTLGLSRIPLALATPRYRTSDDLRANGKNTVAVVTYKGGSWLDRQLRYTFRVGGRTIVGVEDDVDAATFDRFRVGMQTDVIFLPSKPSVSSISPYSPNRNRASNLIFGGLYVAIGITWGALFVGTKRYRARS